MGDDEFQCSYCGKIYVKLCSEEEAIAEKNMYWPNIPLEKCMLVCDDCFEIFRPQQHFFSYPSSV